MLPHFVTFSAHITKQCTLKLQTGSTFANQKLRATQRMRNSWQRCPNNFVYPGDLHLIIRLQARDFYDVIVDEGEAPIISKKSRASNLINSVESEIKYEILRKTDFKHFFKNKSLGG